MLILKNPFRFLAVPSVILVCIFLNSCKKEQVPTVVTGEIQYVTAILATCGGTVTDSGTGVVVQKGVCWGTSDNPTLADSKTNNGWGMGGYYSQLSGLESGTTYYVRAYAINIVGTGYGGIKSFTTLPPSSKKME